MTLGQQLKEARLRFPRKTQRQVADAIGITKRTVIRIENGYVVPQPRQRVLVEMWILRKQSEEREIYQNAAADFE